MASPTVSLKLVIDTKGKRVVYAEAGKDFVDFVFNILSLPVGTVTSLLPKQDMAGCLGDLYEGLVNLSGSYIEPTNKDALLKPILCCYASSLSLLLPNMESKSTYLYSCCRSNCQLNVSNDPKSYCSYCGNFRSLRLNFAKETKRVSPDNNEGGFVKEVATYMIMDNLVVKPMAAASIISLLNEFNVQDVAWSEIAEDVSAVQDRAD
ncbi:hypothetical protein COLO4_10933 [Corchorus olitorius]|uniref:DUF674 domain-containing protein n=1 Tax=Corchorus olitorius TaxID=93759 RepID=A0A1R3K6D3_9ROSI|nr:hypothetical protein COLO4_10933 [Corchorus olitorius]